MPRPGFSCFCPGDSRTDFASFLHCWDKKEYSISRRGQKRTWLVLRAGGFMATFKRVLLADLPLCTHTAFFHRFWGRSGSSKDDRQDSRPVKEDSLPSSGKHQHNTVTADTEDKCWERGICFFSLQGWWLLVKPVHPGVKCGNKSPCRRRVGRVYFLSAWNGCCPCRCGQAPASLGAGHPLEGPSKNSAQESSNALSPAAGWLIPVMSGKLGQSLLRHNLSSRWKWAEKSGIRAGSCTLRSVDILGFSSLDCGLKLFNVVAVT